MNQDQMQGKVIQLSGKIKEAWGRLSDNDVALANGKRDQFLGRLQEVYGLTKEDAEKRFADLEKSCANDTSKVA